MLSITNTGPKARTETRTKGPQSSKDRKDRKQQDRNKPSRVIHLSLSLFKVSWAHRSGARLDILTIGNMSYTLEPRYSGKLCRIYEKIMVKST